MKLSFKHSSQPRNKNLKTISHLSPKKRLGVYFGVVIAIALCVYGVLSVNAHFMVEVPAYGGTLSEGTIGIPRFINPVLATSNADQDLSALIYSGLLKASSTRPGSYRPDLAKGYTISDDGRTYTVTLKKNVTWQDGVPFTADDVLFTIKMIKDSDVRSPLYANWRDVTVKKVNDYTVVFHLRNPYGPFLQNLTVGILPAHLFKDDNAKEFFWSNANTHPIGTGPYKVTGITYRPSGTPRSYTLTAFKNYYAGEPYIQTIVVHFYQSEPDLVHALESGEIESAGEINPADIEKLKKDGFSIKTAPMLRVFGVFLNHNNNKIFLDEYVRRALSISVDRNKIIQNALSGYGTAIDGPLPPGTPGYEKYHASSTPKENLKKAQKLLESDGWTKNKDGIYTKGKGDDAETLAFTLTTSKVPELVKTANVLKDEWEKLGAKVTIKLDEIEKLNEDVIRPRNYEALLFGEAIGWNPDLYAFWHSSGRLDPGLNIALYTNSDADKLLEEARETSDMHERAKKYEAFEKILEEEHPAIFLYAPQFVYVVPKQLHGLTLHPIATPSDRFNDVADWYFNTEHVWTFFLKDK